MAKNIRLSSVLSVLAFASLLLTLFVAVSVPCPVHAEPAIWHVTPEGGGSGTSWIDACTLQVALAGAGEGDEIWVAAGIHVPGTARTDSFVTSEGVALYGGFAGTETERDERDWTAHVTVLSGDIGGDDLTDPYGVVTTTAHIVGENAYHVMVSGLKNAVVDGFIITAGQADGFVREANGGGVVNYDDWGDSYQLSFRNVIFSGNFATGEGGGLFTWWSDLSLTNVTFTGNAAGAGGGMAGRNHADSKLTDVTFAGNSANNGGGMLNTRYSNPTLVNVAFAGNTAAQGGAMSNSEYAAPALVAVTFSANTASDTGGAMWNVSQSSPTLVNVTFLGNVAPQGGAIRNHWRSGPRLFNVTFHGNTATLGGAIYNSYMSDPVLVNAILWGDSPDEIFEEAESPGTTTVTYSIVQGGRPGTGNLDADPLFMDGGGGDLRLLYDSPAIDAGDNGAVPADVTTDLDGSVRFVDIPTIADVGSGDPPVVDMGAYEYRLPVTVSGSVDDPTPIYGQVITFTIAIANTGADLTGGLISATLPAGLHFIGPITLAPLDAGSVSSALPTLAHSLVISAGRHLTVTFPASVTVGLGTRITTTAVFTAPLLPVAVRDSVTLTVGNASPWFTSAPVVTATQDLPYTYTVRADDPDLAYGDALTLTAPLLPSWLALTDLGEGAATLSGAPGEADVGPHAVLLQVADSGGSSVTQSFTITVAEKPWFRVFLPLVVSGAQ